MNWVVTILLGLKTFIVLNMHHRKTETMADLQWHSDVSDPLMLDKGKLGFRILRAALRIHCEIHLSWKLSIARLLRQVGRKHHKLVELSGDHRSSGLVSKIQMPAGTRITR